MGRSTVRLKGRSKHDVQTAHGRVVRRCVRKTIGKMVADGWELRIGRWVKGIETRPISYPQQVCGGGKPRK